MALIADDLIWIVVLGFIVAFVLAFGIGANDVANSFGTSVGSKVLTVRQACIIATICETLGAILLGIKVSETIRKGVMMEGVINSTNSSAEVNVFLYGQLSALTGACIWLLLATFLSLPISGSHSIVGAVVGFILVAYGIRGVNWLAIIKIVISWFLSPVLSGTISVLLFVIFDFAVLRKDNPLEPGLFILPFIYALCIAINTFSILHSAPSEFKFNSLPVYGKPLIIIGCTILTLLIVRLVVVPRLRVRIIEECGPLTVSANTVRSEVKGDEILLKEENCNNTGNELEVKVVSSDSKIEDNNNNQLREKVISSDTEFVKGTETVEHEEKKTKNPSGCAVIQDKPQQDRLFSSIQILAAMFSSFAHGGNDISNAIGPLIAIWVVGTTANIASKVSTPVWILVYGCSGISMGLWVWGKRVIKTIGSDLTTITPASGVSMEIGSATTVILASLLGLPVSTTHCKVGSVVLVGLYRSRSNVNWRVMVNVGMAWLVTVPIAGCISAGVTAILIALLNPRG